MTTRINLISGPRNISTALMYSFANRSDTHVVDEPMYAYYLHKSGADHPGRDDILKALPSSIEDVKANYLFQEVKEDIYFIKGMAKHYVELDYSFLLDLKNLFLIRDPAQLIVSFQKVIPNPKMADIGLKKEWELFEFLQSKGNQPIVLDSNAILENPKQGLEALCQSLDIPFSNRMLQWKKGPIPEDGIWAPHWYSTVHQSTKFGEPSRFKPEIPKTLSSLYEESLYYYKKLHAHHLLN